MFKDKKTQADGNICLTAEKNNTEMILRAIEAMRTRVKTEAPLIHCITNPISIHDCANVVLAAGGRPMMAEHPAEVAEITVTAGALALNLGNITDARRESILIAEKAAMAEGIPVILDMVGIGCSAFRRAVVMKFLEQKIPRCQRCRCPSGGYAVRKQSVRRGAPGEGCGPDLWGRRPGFGKDGSGDRW